MTMGHNSIAGEQLQSILERIERLQEQKQALQGDISDIFAEAKSNGFDTKTIREVLKIRKMDAAEWQERTAMLDLYLHAAGLL